MKKTENDNTEDRYTTNQEEEQLIPLIMPEATPTEHNTEDEEDEEELDSKAAHRKLIESFTDDEGEKTDFSFFYILFK